MKRVLKAVVTRAGKGASRQRVAHHGPRGKQGTGTLGHSGSTRRSVKLSAHVRYSQLKLAGVGTVRCHD